MSVAENTRQLWIETGYEHFALYGPENLSINKLSKKTGLSRRDDFVFNDDGSLTLYIQNESAGSALEANWLPAPAGPFYNMMRLYSTEEAA